MLELVSVVLALGILVLCLVHFHVVSKLVADARLERETLLTRIQAWEPEPKSEPPKPPQPQESQGSVLAEEPPRFTADQLASLGLRENSDGGFIDAATGALWETVEDVQEWRAMCRKKGWPENVHPGLLQDDGAPAAVEAAKNVKRT